MTSPVTTPAFFSPLSLVKAICNRKFFISVVWGLATVAVLAVVRQLEPIYSAEAVVVVESQRIPESFVSATVNANLQDRLGVLRQEILTYSRLVQIIEKFDLYREQRRGGRPMEDVVETMRTDVRIQLERGLAPNRPGAFRVTYQGPNPTTVAQVTNLIASFFIDENLRTREVQAVGTSDFLNAQLAEAKKRLEEQEGHLSRYKLEHSGELPQQENSLLTSLGQLKVQLTGVQDNLNRAQQNKLTLESSLDNADGVLRLVHEQSAAPLAGRAPLAGAASASGPRRLAEVERIQAELDTLRLRYSEEHPDVKAALDRARAAAAREAVAAPAAPPPAPGLRTLPPPDAPPNPQVTAMAERIQSMRGQVAAAEREIAALAAERQKIISNIASIEARLQRLPVNEQRLASVTRDYAVTRENYQSLLEKKMAADVAADMEKRQKAERFVMLEGARTPERPIKPKRELMNAAGSVVGLLLGVVLALGVEFQKGAVLGEWELPAKTLVLGRIPVVETRRSQKARRRRRTAAIAAALVLVLLAAAGAAAFWLGFLRP